MKTFIQLNKMGILFSMLSLCLLAMPQTTTAQQYPDLRVSQITTPGGWKAGHCNKLKVMVTNSQQVGVSQKIPVIVTISFGGGNQPLSLVGETSSGIGPNDNSGQPVWFHNINVPTTGSASVVATVNPDLEIQESVPNNNQLQRTVNVVGHCASSQQVSSGGGSSSSGSRGKNLTVYLKKKGASRYSKPTNLGGIKILAQKGSKKYTTQTNKEGQATFKNLPSGTYVLYAQKSGCTKTSKKYRMSGRDAKVSMELSCRS